MTPSLSFNQTGTLQYGELAVPLALYDMPTFCVEVEIMLTDSGVALLSEGSTGNTRTFEIGCDETSTTTRFKAGSTSVFWYHQGVPTLNEFHKFELCKLDGTTYELFVNDTSLGTRTEAGLHGLGIDYDRVMRAYNTYASGLFRTFRIRSSRNGPILRDFSVSASGGTGTTWPDAQNVGDISLIGYPANDLHWQGFSAEPTPSTPSGKGPLRTMASGGQVNDAMFETLAGQGHGGALPDKLKASGNR